jgi:hypothetical protein
MSPGRVRPRIAFRVRAVVVEVIARVAHDPLDLDDAALEPA